MTKPERNYVLALSSKGLLYLNLSYIIVIKDKDFILLSSNLLLFWSIRRKKKIWSLLQHDQCNETYENIALQRFLVSYSFH